MPQNRPSRSKRSSHPKNLSWSEAHHQVTQPEMSRHPWQAAYTQARQELESPEAKLYLPDEVAEKILSSQKSSAEAVPKPAGWQLMLTGGLVLAITITGFIRSYRHVAAVTIPSPKT